MFEAAASGLTTTKIMPVWWFESCQIFILMKCLKLPSATTRADSTASPLTTLRGTFTDRVRSGADAFRGRSHWYKRIQAEAARRSDFRLLARAVGLRDQFALPACPWCSLNRNAPAN